MMRYFLPCSCGRKIPLSATQAGETLRCECGKSLTAPTLRELRQLEPAADTAPAPRRRLAWSPTQGVLFALGGVLVLVAGVILGMTAFQRQQLRTDKPRIIPESMDVYLAEIDTNTPLQNFEVWQTEILQEGLQRQPPEYVLHRQVARVLRWIMIIAGTGGAIGLGMIIAAFVLRPRGAGAARPKKA
jgi:hypothetical protein